ncbi:uncharacterized protein [Chelonus insularis]|uniref:uncharacterized protein isoform X2 n=1 Tax=Chelonus insularis TaxID=460826 RepID=UPI00158CDF51|nr:uncharacterized protein LOC118064657 isoform X2 [Chelonus insularis]
MHKIVRSLRISFASRRDVIIITTEAYRFRQLRGKRTRKPYATTTTALPEFNKDDETADKLETETTGVDEKVENNNDQTETTDKQEENVNENEKHDEEIPPNTSFDSASAHPEDLVIGRLMSTLSSDSLTTGKSKEETIKVKRIRTEDIPDITSLFTSNTGIKPRTESVFDGLETHEIRSIPRTNLPGSIYEKAKLIPENGVEESKTIGPYESVQDYVNDEPESGIASEASKDQEEDSSTILPNAEPAYRYNIKVRSNGKVLDPPSK